MKPISDGGDEEMKKKMESLKEDLKDKEEEFETLEDLYQTLVVKERKVNDELQDGRKELINVSFLISLHFNLDFIVNKDEFFYMLQGSVMHHDFEFDCPHTLE